MFPKFRYFNFIDVFTYERGQRFTRDEHIEGGVPYISSTKENNGIDTYVTPPIKTKKGVNVVTHINKISLNNSGSVGYCFYHNYEFIASDHVTVLNIKKEHNQKLTPNIALFLKPILEKLRNKYSFGREISNSRLEKEKIFLPAKLCNSQYVPDFEFMENYITQIGKKIEWKNQNIVDPRFEDKKINTEDWKEFSLLEIFKKGKFNNYKRGKDQISETDLFGLPLISSTAKTNGFVGYKENPNFIFTKGAITLANNGSIGSMFYQDNDFCATQDVTILSNINNTYMNKYIAVFLISILKKEKFRYSYGRKWNNKNLYKTKIKLPVTTQGKPDWQFMESYIKSLPYSSSL
jgi:hypothetical protein